jgi:hypothetical protein
MNMEEQLQDSAMILKAKGPSSKEFVSLSCSSNGSSLEPQILSGASRKVSGQRDGQVNGKGAGSYLGSVGDRKVNVKIMPATSSKKLKRSEKNCVEDSIKVIAKEGLVVDQTVSASLGVHFDPGSDEKEIEEGEIMEHTEEGSLSNRSKTQDLIPAMTGNLVGAHDEPHQEQ